MDNVFTLRSSSGAKLNRNLLGTMTEFGRYRLTYESPSENFGYHIETDIQMSISAEADLERMCDFFNSFLKASGYVYDGRVVIGQ
jgi:hypothetical protein